MEESSKGTASSTSESSESKKSSSSSSSPSPSSLIKPDSVDDTPQRHPQHIENAAAMTRRTLTTASVVTGARQQKGKKGKGGMNPDEFNAVAGGGGGGGRRWSTLPRRPSGFEEQDAGGSGGGAAMGGVGGGGQNVGGMGMGGMGMGGMGGIGMGDMGGMGMGMSMAGGGGGQQWGFNGNNPVLSSGGDLAATFGMGGVGGMGHQPQQLQQEGGVVDPPSMAGQGAVDACIRDLSQRRALMERGAGGGGGPGGGFDPTPNAAASAASSQQDSSQGRTGPGGNLDGNNFADVEGLMRNIAEQEERLRVLREQHRIMKDQYSGEGGQGGSSGGQQGQGQGGGSGNSNNNNPFNAPNGEEGLGARQVSVGDRDSFSSRGGQAGGSGGGDSSQWYICQHCNIRAFASKEEAAEHESGCSGSGSAGKDQGQAGLRNAAAAGIHPQLGGLFSHGNQDRAGQQGQFGSPFQQDHHQRNQDMLFSAQQGAGNIRGHGSGIGQGVHGHDVEDHSALIAMAAAAHAGMASRPRKDRSHSGQSHEDQLASSLRNAGGVARSTSSQSIRKREGGSSSSSRGGGAANANAAAGADDDGTELMNTVDPSTGRRLYKILDEPVPLSMESDKDWITPLHCFVRRHCVQLFTASASDVATPSKGKRRPIRVGQVGIRCPHCWKQQRVEDARAADGGDSDVGQGGSSNKDASKSASSSSASSSAPCRERGSVYYPTTLSSIYNATMNLLQRHLHACASFPPDMMARYRELKADDARSGTSKKYWVDSARSLGLVDTSYGIRFSALTPPPLPQLRTEQVSAGIRSQTRRNSVEFFSSRSNARRSSNFTTGPVGGVSSSQGGPGAERRGSTASSSGNQGSSGGGSSSEGGGAGTQRLKNPLVLADDEKYATGFSFHLLSQMQPCVFTEADRLGKRKGLPAGFAGIACRHCYGGYGAGRFFPSSIKTLSDTSKTLNVLYNHMNRCRKCPQDVRDKLTVLRATHDDERSRMKFGSQKAFFARIWGRLHNSGSPAAPPSKRQKTAQALVAQAHAQVAAQQAQAQAQAAAQQRQQQLQQGQQGQQAHQEANEQAAATHQAMLSHHQGGMPSDAAALASAMGMHHQARGPNMMGTNPFAAMAATMGSGGMGGMGHFNPAAAAMMGAHPNQGMDAFAAAGGGGTFGQGQGQGGFPASSPSAAFDDSVAVNRRPFQSSSLSSASSKAEGVGTGGGDSGKSDSSSAAASDMASKPQALMGHQQFVPPIPMDGLDVDSPPKARMMHPRGA